MRERIARFANEIQNKKHILQLVNKLELCLKIEAESGTFYLSFKDGKVACQETCMHARYTATISGKDALLDQLFNGDLKLRQLVKMNYFTTDCSFRSQLVLESLFYLARPLPV
ncbi:SCP2 sterol-binding domain-containing protein [Bacillus sp. ISL-55]|uniref:SCP2 sterol-binding domain-containing protein n=1 Tax=Bacillus sp. ISL-55 TaxID=2819134 RepID=UPI001BE77D3E|nr:SCP2 sterol-binding domain-containing protein [Bacillus sp. ISL-55]MBT2693171.1 SCP2 sterol-binding domain-containing protein [Bacillus sp. ISL-55]